MKSCILAGAPRRTGAFGACLAAMAVALSAPASAFDGMGPSLSAAPFVAAGVATPDPERWLPLAGFNGPVPYFDRSAVRRRGAQVGVVVMRNAPAGVIRTTGGDPIRSSLKRIVLDCALSTYAVVEQTLYPKRFARGEALYTMRAPQGGAMAPVAGSRLASELLDKLCR